MAKKTESVTVDGIEYQITQLDTTPGLRLYNKLARLLGDAIRGELAGAKDVESAMAGAMLRAISIIPEEDMLSLGRTFAGTCKVRQGELWLDLTDAIYEQHFAGQLSHWTMWVLACLRVNFSDFLSRAKRSIAGAAAAGAPVTSP